MKVHTYSGSIDLVPLAERMRWMRVFRLACAAIALAAWALLPELVHARPVVLAASVGGYLALTLGGEAAWRLSGRRGLSLFGGLVVLDGLFLGWAAYGLTDAAGPLRYLVVVHIVCVTLLASFRTGIKLALWHSLLIVTMFHAQEAGLLDAVGTRAPPLGGVEYRSLIASVVVFWLAALATATFAAMNERELRRRRFDLEALARLAARLETAADAEEVGRGLTAAAADAFGFQRVLLFAAPAGGPVLLDERGAGEAVDASQVPGSLLTRATGSQETLLVSRFSPADDRWLAELLPDAGNLVLVPLHADARTIGLLVCEHDVRPGSRIERRVVSMLERFASQAALALANAWLVEQLRRSAATDGLTGLANRRMFDEALGREIARARRTGEPVSLVLADIDHFKRLNDEHGHLAGDDALRRVAEALEQHSRAVDLVTRYGGEEFAVILPATDATTALVAAERLRAAVASAPTPVPVTASFGVATLAHDASGAEALVRVADAALYASKAAGRDRVTGAAHLPTASGDV
jgi:two-component system cell cycle response regulator